MEAKDRDERKMQPLAWLAQAARRRLGCCIDRANVKPVAIHAV
jgi:hypothetical protein